MLASPTKNLRWLPVNSPAYKTYVDLVGEVGRRHCSIPRMHAYRYRPDGLGSLSRNVRRQHERHCRVSAASQTQHQAGQG